MLKCVLIMGLMSLSCPASDLVGDVRTAAGQNDYARADGYIQNYKANRGQTPESVLALRWRALTALAQKKYDQADRYAEDTYQRVLLGASIEVEAQVLAANGQRTEAVSMLEAEAKKYSAALIHARIQNEYHHQ